MHQSIAVRATPIRKEAIPIPTVTSVGTPITTIGVFGSTVDGVVDGVVVSPLIPKGKKKVKSESIVHKNKIIKMYFD